jgi:hypothetical protein
MNLDFNGTTTTLAKAQSLVKNVTDMFIVRPSGKSPIIGAGGFVFDILDDEEVLVESEATDHYVEDNSAIQDHITHRPETFTLRGYVGEITDLFPNTALSILQGVASLGSIGGFAPSFGRQAAQVYSKAQDVAAKVGNVYNQAQNLYDLISPRSTADTRQQKAFQTFYGYRSNRQLLTVETPFANFENMIITSIRARQRGDSRFRSDFAVTFKKMRFAKTRSTVPAESKIKKTVSVTIDSVTMKDRAGEENSPVSYKGAVTGQSTVNGETISNTILNPFRE